MGGLRFEDGYRTGLPRACRSGGLCVSDGPELSLSAFGSTKRGTFHTREGQTIIYEWIIHSYLSNLHIAGRIDISFPDLYDRYDLAHVAGRGRITCMLYYGGP